MHIITPVEMTSAWEGELVESGIVKAATRSLRPVVSLGRTEIWPVAEALESETGKKWVAPSGDAHYWLARLTCTLHEPSGAEAITEATQSLFLRPQPHAAGEKSAYAQQLFPVRLGVEDKTDFTLSLGPELGFASGASVKAGEVGATIEYRKVFPVIQGYGVGEANPYWEFKPHAANPLIGSQCVYAILVARAPASGLRAHVEVTVTTQTVWGPIKFGTPEEAQEHTTFTLSRP